MSYANLLAANRRLCILKLLLESAGTANESVLQMALQHLGHVAGVDRAYVRDLMRSLATADCITVEMFNDQVMVARLTDRGAAAARGHITVEGVAQPSFGG